MSKGSDYFCEDLSHAARTEVGLVERNQKGHLRRHHASVLDPGLALDLETALS